MIPLSGVFPLHLMHPNVKWDWTATKKNNVPCVVSDFFFHKGNLCILAAWQQQIEAKSGVQTISLGTLYHIDPCELYFNLFVEVATCATFTHQVSHQCTGTCRCARRSLDTTWWGFMERLGFNGSSIVKDKSNMSRIWISKVLKFTILSVYHVSGEFKPNIKAHQ